MCIGENGGELAVRSFPDNGLCRDLCSVFCGEGKLNERRRPRRDGAWPEIPGLCGLLVFVIER